MTEKQMWQVIRKKLPSFEDRLERIENAASVGMPDVNFCTRGIECWIELKAPTEPKNHNAKLFKNNYGLSQNQKNWFKKHLQAGGLGIILICTQKRWLAIEGRFADEINNWTLKECFMRAFWRKGGLLAFEPDGADKSKCADDAFLWASLRNAIYVKGCITRERFFKGD